MLCIFSLRLLLLISLVLFCSPLLPILLSVLSVHAAYLQLYAHTYVCMYCV